MQGEFLAKKEIRRILEQLEKQWGCSLELDYLFFRNNKNRISLMNRDFVQLDTSKLRLNSVGLYFCEVMDNGEIRLSIEGSQLVGPTATKNVILLDFVQTRKWLYGQDIEFGSQSAASASFSPASAFSAVASLPTGFVILQHDDFFLGCGRLKNGVISNHVSKIRRIGTLS